MANLSFNTLAAALLLGGSGLAMAANDGQARANDLLNTDPQYRETWQGGAALCARLTERKKKNKRTDEQINEVTEDGDG